MDLKQTLLENRSKEGVRKLADWIGTDGGRFQQFWDLMLSGEEPYSSYAAWVIDHSLLQHVDGLLPHRAAAFQALQEDHHPAIYRNVLKHLSRVPIPEEIEGPFYDLAISWIGNPQLPAAIRVHSMELAYQIGKEWPELLAELKQVIAAHLDDGSAGFRSRGNKILKRIGNP